MISFCAEPWDSIKNEVLPAWRAHHAAVADPDDVGDIALDPDWDRYQQASDLGQLVVIVARDNGILAGYVFFFVLRGLHYRKTLFANWDLYWINPESRGHMVGVRLFRAAEAEAIRRGCHKMTGACKTWLDTRAIFKRCGWKHVEHLHTKKIGGVGS